jgi:Zn finger protein HypA/HybF involved in hydrogenase expression
MGTFKKTIMVEMQCKDCHSSERKHKANGLCEKCYIKVYQREYRRKLSTGKTLT